MKFYFLIFLLSVKSIYSQNNNCDNEYTVLQFMAGLGTSDCIIYNEHKYSFEDFFYQNEWDINELDVSTVLPMFEGVIDINDDEKIIILLRSINKFKDYYNDNPDYFTKLNNTPDDQLEEFITQAFKVE